MSLDLSVLILARNEQRNIGDCIASVQKYLDASEIIVIDDGSNDNTPSIAQSMGARVVEHAMNGDWGQQQTFAIGEAKCRWVYFIDADERMTETLGKEISKAVEKNELFSYWNARLNHFCGVEIRYGGWFPDYGLHLFPKEGSYVTGFVHPQIHAPYPKRQLPKSAYLYHYTYASWEQYLRKLNFYTTLGARKKFESGGRVGFLGIFAHVIWGVFKFFIIERGFLDGREGVLLAMSHGVSVFMKYSKLYYLGKGIGENYKGDGIK